MSSSNRFPPVQITIADDLPPCLVALGPQQRAWLNASIGNDEVSSDEEIQAHWVGELGLTQEQADAAISYRDRCLMPFFQLFPEVMTDLYDHA